MWSSAGKKDPWTTSPKQTKSQLHEQDLQGLSSILPGKIGGWGGEYKTGRSFRFVSFVRVYARSGSEVGIGENLAGPPPFPFPFGLRRVFRSSFLWF